MIQRWPVLGLLLGAALTLQGCVAVLLPIAAAGVIGKKEVDKARARTRAAEDSFDPALPPEVFVGEATAAVAATALPEPTSQETETPATMSALDRLSLSIISNAYLPFARHALGEAAKREKGEIAQHWLLAFAQ